MKLENEIHMLFICDICIGCTTVAKVETTVYLTCMSLSAQWWHVFQFFTMYPFHQINI